MRPESSSSHSGDHEDGYWPSALEVWSAERPQELWRRHSDAVNRALIGRWLRPTGSILKTDLWDEAVGDGLHSALSALASEVVGIDSSAEVVSRARGRHPQLVGLEADVRRLPFPDGRFDAVVSNSTLDHFESTEDIVVAVRELRRVLRPGGEMLLTLDNPLNPLVALTKAFPRRLLNNTWVRHGRASGRLGLLPYFVGQTLRPRRLAQLLRDEGFDLREQAAIVHAPRIPAVLVGTALERRADGRAHARYLRFLAAFERAGHWPTRYLTGNFVAVHALRRLDGEATPEG